MIIEAYLIWEILWLISWLFWMRCWEIWSHLCSFPLNTKGIFFYLKCDKNMNPFEHLNVNVLYLRMNENFFFIFQFPRLLLYPMIPQNKNNLKTEKFNTGIKEKLTFCSNQNTERSILSAISQIDNTPIPNFYNFQKLKLSLYESP